ncbi:MAG: lipoate--protein ligase family protein [Pirellulaceae bacterium]|nr:lipoate--protein ligase family protein [Pirellulaceae bacterium]
MQLFDTTLDSPVENIALDESLLLYAEQHNSDLDCLRVWEPNQYAVVMGRSGKVEEELNLPACQQDGVAVLRRASGGGTVLTGPGCLMYALVLNLDHHPQFRDNQNCHDTILNELIGILAPLGLHCQIQGFSDLVYQNRKVSGNSLRRTRSHVLYHGTLLCQFDLEKISRYLTIPPRKPDYRNNRSHLDFVANIDHDVEQLKQALIQHWAPDAENGDIPRQLLNELLDSKYQDPHWYAS